MPVSGRGRARAGVVEGFKKGKAVKGFKKGKTPRSNVLVATVPVRVFLSGLSCECSPRPVYPGCTTFRSLKCRNSGV